MNIGVTGGFLSGKSTLSRSLADKLHCELFSCDDFVRTLYRKKVVRKKILDTFGERLYKGSVLQKDQLSQLAFQSEEQLRKLEAIIHPLVEAEIIRKTSQKKTTVHDDSKRIKHTIFEIPLLYETGMNRWMDECVLVLSDKKTCSTRAKLRGFTKKDFELRTRFQWEARKKKQWNPWIVKNQGDKNALKQQASLLAKTLKSLPK